MSERKGYGERVGLTFGLILSAVGLLIVLLLPGPPGVGVEGREADPRRVTTRRARAADDAVPAR